MLAQQSIHYNSCPVIVLRKILNFESLTLAFVLHISNREMVRVNHFDIISSRDDPEPRVTSRKWLDSVDRAHYASTCIVLDWILALALFPGLTFKDENFRVRLIFLICQKCPGLRRPLNYVTLNTRMDLRVQRKDGCREAISWYIMMTRGLNSESSLAQSPNQIFSGPRLHAAQSK